MTKEELTEEINFFAGSAEPQSEVNLMQLYFHYLEMFKEYVGAVPEFDIIDNKGRIELK